MIIAIIITLSCICVLLSYFCVNLFLKNEKQEDVLASYLLYLDAISKVIETSDAKLRELDQNGVFKNDDEVGFVFEQIQSIQKLLNNFIIKNEKL